VSITYIVKTGDTLTSIAKKFNRPSWQELYYHPENADFRRKRPNPNLIFTGDAIQIPGPADPPIPPFPRPTPPPAPPPAKVSKVNKKSVYLPEQDSKRADDKGSDWYYMMRFAKVVADPDSAVIEGGSAEVDPSATISRIDYVRRQDSSTFGMVTIDHYDFTFSFDKRTPSAEVMIFLEGQNRERVSPAVAEEIYNHPGHFVLRPRKPGTSGYSP